MSKTKTTMFLLPCLDFTMIDLGVDFLNAYIAHDENSKYTDPVLFLVFKTAPKLNKLYEGCLEKYDADSDKYVIVHPISDKFIDDYIKFIHGQYSKLSDLLKNKIKKMYGTDYEAYRVVIKSPTRKRWLEEFLELDKPLDDSAELMSIMDEEKETLKTQLKIC